MSETATVVRPAMAKHIERAIECTVKVARLYKKHGQPPVFHAIEPTYSPPRQRMRLARVPKVQVQNVCSRCGLLFIGSGGQRCQCKVKTKRKP
jgi:hypothetical protein